MKPLTLEEITRYGQAVSSEGKAYMFVGWMLGRAASSGIIAEEIRKLMGSVNPETEILQITA